MKEIFVLGVDVGTGSARAGLFDVRGTLLAAHSHPIRTWNPAPDYFEQSSADIWAAIGLCTRECLKQSGVAPEKVVGISFDATCSLVAVGPDCEPIPVNSEGEAERDIIVWMDHRALAEADEINAGNHEVVRYVGGVISPEMQTPKLLWLKRNLAKSYEHASQFFDLPDYLSFRATGNDTRSLCTLVCKWTYLGHENRFDEAYFAAIGLSDVLPKIGTRVGAIGENLGYLTPQSAQELGLTTHCVVGQGLIDAHAGGLGVLGAIWDDETKDGETPDPRKLETTLALIGGTSNCHMAVSREAKFIGGVWGPYFGAMVPQMWLQEGGQSTAGAAIDHVIADHPDAAHLFSEAKNSGQTVYEILNAQLAQMSGKGGEISPALAKDFHVLPYFLGNRSPNADPHARAIYDGVSLDKSRQSAAIRYLGAIQAVAYGTRDIVRALNEGGYAIDAVFVTGGGTKNPLWLQEHADATGLKLILPREGEAVLLGSAIVAASAAGVHGNLFEAMRKMSGRGKEIEPRPQWRAFHDAKFEIFRELYSQQKSRREKMNGF